MNDRIKELAEQAKCFMTDNVPHLSRVHNRALSVDEAADIFEQKFAELIVQECADVCGRFGESGDGYTCSAEILEHFGVEE